MVRVLPWVVMPLLFVFPTMTIATISVPLAPVFVLGALDRFFRLAEVVRVFSYQRLVLGALILLIATGHAIFWQSAGILLTIVQLTGSVLMTLWISVSWPHWFPTGDSRAVAVLTRILVLILVLSLVELVGDFSAIYKVTDSIFHSGAPVASNVERELAIAGVVRPRLFTSEPSHLAKNYLVVSLGMMLCSTSIAQLMRIGVLLAAGALVIRSPIVAAGFPVLALQLMLRRKIHVGAAFSISIVILLGAAVALHTFSGRWEMVRLGQDLSPFVRLEMPLRLAGDAVSNSPLFGVGPGNDRFIGQRASSLRADRGLESGGRFGIDINNGYATLLISYGILGGTLYVIFLLSVLGRVAGKLPIAYWFFAAVLPLLLGAVFSPRFWVSLFVPALIFAHEGGRDR